MSNNYEDIISLPHFVSEKHPPMSKASRAAQFSPFAALTGYDEEISETARLTDRKLNLSEEDQNNLNAILTFLKDNISLKPAVDIEYFIKDEKKSGGVYIHLKGNLRRILENERTVVFTDGTEISLDDILNIEIEKG